MKKTVLTLTFCLLAAVGCYAQLFRGKVVLGANGAQVDGDNRSGWHKLGLVTGIGVELPLSEKVSLEPLLLYSAKGSITSDKELTQGLPAQTFSLNYIEMPVLLNYYVRPDLKAQFGIIPEYLLSATIDPGNGQGEADRLSEFKTVDLMGCFGLDYVISPKFSFGGRFSYSAVNINRNSTFLIIPGNSVQGGLRNNVLTFSLSYTLFGGSDDTRPRIVPMRD